VPKTGFFCSERTVFGSWVNEGVHTLVNKEATRKYLVLEKCYMYFEVITCKCLLTGLVVKIIINILYVD